MLRNIIIRGGHVIDPANGTDEIRDVFIAKDKISDPFAEDKADLVFDAKGRYVFPGLIDYHAHVFPKSTEIGIDADSSMLCQGVTAVVDPGSAGAGNFETFVEDVPRRSAMHVEAYINLCPSGMPTMKFHEDFDPKHWDREKLGRYLRKYPDLLHGLKIRVSGPIMGDLPKDVLKKAVDLAQDLGCRLCVHSTNPYIPMEEVADTLQKGDVLAHVYHGTGSTIIGEDGKVLPALIQARKRGVIMDAANGGNHWNFGVAEAAISQGFLPDIISTDLTCKTLFKDPVFSLPFIMSKYLMLGLPLKKVVECCTAAPARLLLAGKDLGTLSSGARADVAVFDLADKKTVFSDTAGNRRTGEKLLVPCLTLLGGELAWRSIAF